MLKDETMKRCGFVLFAFRSFGFPGVGLVGLVVWGVRMQMDSKLRRSGLVLKKQKRQLHRGQKFLKSSGSRCAHVHVGKENTCAVQGVRGELVKSPKCSCKENNKRK